MAILGISSLAGRLICPDNPAIDARMHLAHSLRNLPKNAPIVVMVHGYKYHPEIAATNPHELLFSTEPKAKCHRTVSWPRGLGFSEMSRDDGLAIGFGWEGVASDFQTPFFGFGQVYIQARRAGGNLARLLNWIAELAPGRRVDIVAHSLGASVTLTALARLKPAILGRIILMGAAEFDAVAARRIAESQNGQNVEIFNLCSRENVVVDRLFEFFAPGRERGLSIGRGHNSYGPNWLNVHLDDPQTVQSLAQFGAPVHLPKKLAYVDHWAFYTRAGVLHFYQKLLRERTEWRMSDLKRTLGPHSLNDGAQMFGMDPSTPPLTT